MHTPSILKTINPNIQSAVSSFQDNTTTNATQTMTVTIDHSLDERCVLDSCEPCHTRSDHDAIKGCDGVSNGCDKLKLDAKAVDSTSNVMTSQRSWVEKDQVQIDGLPEVEDRQRQQLTIEDQVQVVIEGYRYSRIRVFLYYICVFLSLGGVWLICQWMPRWWIVWVGDRAPLEEAQWFVVVNQYGQRDIVRPEHQAYGKSVATVFSADQIQANLAQSTELLNDDLGYSMEDPLEHLVLVEYRHVRLAFHPFLQKFLVIGYWKDAGWTSVQAIKTGLTTEQYEQHMCVFGPNLINIREKPTLILLRDEVLNPFYIFQFASIVLWCIEDYYYYAICIFLISAVGILSTLLETKKTIRRMRELSRFECSVSVFRDGTWCSVSSADLVPGDLIDIVHLHTIPCDAILVDGDCIVNESMLTGESVPVSKVPVSSSVLQRLNLSTPQISAETTKYFLFMGTKIVRARSRGHDTVTRALVVRTGFNTAKGALVRSMLFPKPNNFQFYRDSFRFIGVLAIIAVIGFLLSLINFIRLGVDKETMVLRAFDLITIVVPPALPATMSIGTRFALSRLKKTGIYCTSPPRVNLGGKIDCMCFDKTGTLTEDGLDLQGFRVVTSSHGQTHFDEERHSVTDMDYTDTKAKNATMTKLGCLMASCHALNMVEGQLVGDPLDLKMFEFSGWQLIDESMDPLPDEEIPIEPEKSYTDEHTSSTIAATNARKVTFTPPLDHPTVPVVELDVLHTFEFVSSLRRMSVVVRQGKNPHLDLFVKGAPEALESICLPSSIPEDYAKQLHWYTHRGLRVIACAYKQLTNTQRHQLYQLSRQDAESSLIFLGFIIFENKIKPRTVPAIQALHNANIRQIMCTGDNVLTAISVARESGLVDQDVEIYIPTFQNGSSTDPSSDIQWQSVLREGDILDQNTLCPVGATEDAGESYCLAITGEAFHWILNYAPTQWQQKMFTQSIIYARMSPDEKQELVSGLQDMGYCVGFCGDGANDCGALKAGDIGISLSEAEASVAAPFTSSTMDIHCVIDVIKEGRAALVTSFSCFKYMALYSMIQFTSVTLLYALGGNLGDFQYLYIDLILIIPIAIFMGNTSAWPYLSPTQPTASLISKEVLTSLLGQICIAFVFQIISFFLVRHQYWYIEPVFDRDGPNNTSPENTVLFLLSSFQYILIAIVFSVGPPYRKPLITNVYLVATLAILIALTIWLTVWPISSIVHILNLEDIPLSFRFVILGLAAGNFLASYVCENYIFGLLVQGLSRERQRIQSWFEQQPKVITL